VDIFGDDTPIIFSEDDYIAAMYSIISSDFKLLAPIDGESELVLALGQDEQRVTIGSDRSIRFNNIEHLADLRSEDFLSLRLYLNNDSDNVLWEWAFAYVAFVDEYGDNIALGQNFSHPRPSVKIGKNSELDEFTISDISVIGSGEHQRVEFKIHGRVTSALADITHNGMADINAVTIIVPDVGEFDDFKRISLDLISAEDETIEQKDYLPFDSDEKEFLPKHTFIGEFSYQISIPITQPSTTIIVEAENAIGNLGYDSITVNFDLKLKADEPEIESASISSIVNSEGTQNSLFKPLWVQVSDPRLNEKNIKEARLDFRMGTNGKIKSLDLIRDKKSGRFFANMAFIAVAKKFKDEGLRPSNILNIYDIENSLTGISYYSPDDARTSPSSSLTSPLATATNSLNWGYTAASPPNYYYYIENSNIKISWFSDIVDRPEFEVSGVDILERTWQSTSRGRRTKWKVDSHIELIDIGENDIIESNSDKSNPKKGRQFAFRIKKGAIDNPEKCLNVRFKYKGAQGQNVKQVGRSNITCFGIDSPKIIILAIDGLAYDSALAVVNNVEENSSFAEIFSVDKTVNRDKPALSALPTITWANWPGVFSGQPPKDHGVLGNSYFPRETRTRPIYSAGVGKGILTPGRNQAIDQAGVALFDGMNDMAKTGAGSIYDNIADVFDAPGGRKLGMYSLRPFFTKHSKSKVDVVGLETFIRQPIGGVAEHNWDAARSLDDSSPKTWLHTIDGITASSALAIVGLNTGIGKGAGPRSRAAWIANKSELDVLSIYMPGPDNVGHGLGDVIGIEAENSNKPVPFALADVSHKGFDVSVPVNSLAIQAKDVTDKALGRLWSTIQQDGYSNAVIFALTADHGQHQYIGVDHNDWPENDSRVNEALQYNVFVSDIANILEPNLSSGGLGKKVWDGGGIFTTFYQYDAIFSGNGGLGQIYLKNGFGWTDPPSFDQVQEVAVHLHKYAQNKGESGDTGVPRSLFYNEKISPKRNVRKVSDSDIRENYYNTTERYITNGAFGYPSAIFVRSDGFDSEYKWIDVQFEYEVGESFLAGDNYKVDSQGAPIVKTISYRSIDEFLLARENAPKALANVGFNWPSFEARMQEMNGDRSGDIIVITDGREGYLTLDNTGESFIGWHGGPTKSESEVPLMLSMPGKAFVDNNGEEFTGLKIPEKFRSSVQAEVGRLLIDEQSNRNGESFLRNWQLSPLIVEGVRGLRSE
jgi:predicted AlkP superfamily pyrophosphatase or phosphodiesterase